MTTASKAWCGERERRQRDAKRRCASRHSNLLPPGSHYSASTRVIPPFDGALCVKGWSIKGKE